MVAKCELAANLCALAQEHEQSLQFISSQQRAAHSFAGASQSTSGRHTCSTAAADGCEQCHAPQMRLFIMLQLQLIQIVLCTSVAGDTRWWGETSTALPNFLGAPTSSAPCTRSHQHTLYIHTSHHMDAMRRLWQLHCIGHLCKHPAHTRHTSSTHMFGAATYSNISKSTMGMFVECCMSTC
jgi:hypothetical protein